MPIKIPNDLPASKILKEENIFVMDETRALSQRIRPLKLIIVNIMPTKIVTETQLLRLLSNTPLQIEVDWLCMESHNSKNTPQEHLMEFYKTFNEIKDNKYDGLIVTGAPVEKLKFEDVDYWDELTKIFDWANTNVFSSFFICWASQAALYYYHGVEKYELEEKLTGVYQHHTNEKKMKRKILRGFDFQFYAPHSRHTAVRQEDIEKINSGAADAPAKPDIAVQAGDLKYADLNGDGTINDFDKRAIGKPNLPTTTLGWTIGGSWKGFSISVLFQGSFDYSFAINGTGIESGKSQFQPLHQKRWTQERYENGESIEFPRLTMQDGTINSASAYNSDFWLINAWYIRLKTVDLGYQLPKTALPKFLDNVRFYVNAYNLLTFTGYDKYQQDPEIKTNTAGDAYMNQRVVNLGVQLTF